MHGVIGVNIGVITIISARHARSTTLDGGPHGITTNSKAMTAEMNLCCVIPKTLLRNQPGVGYIIISQKGGSTGLSKRLHSDEI